MFAWAQTRLNLPGWYGLGSGLATVVGDGEGLREVRQAYQGWLLLAVLLDNAEMSLAKLTGGSPRATWPWGGVTT